MKILLLSIGTRGDMEPFLAIAELLEEKRYKEKAMQLAEQELREELYKTLFA